MKRFWPCFLALCLFLGACRDNPGSTPSASEESQASTSRPPSQDAGSEPAASEPPQTDFFGYGRSFLSRELQQVYDRLAEAAEAFDLDSSVPLPPNIGEKELQELINWFWNDNPRYYWASPTLTTQQTSGERFLHLEIAGSWTLEDIQRQLEEADAVADRFLAELEQGLSPVEAVIRLHNRLGFHINYNRYSQIEDAHTIYGGLINRSAICDGYSRSFQYLMDLCGIPCIYVAGYTLRGLPHSWNAVELEGEWYYVDITWDDRGRVRHDYCLASLEEMEREHVWDNTQYPSLPGSGSGNLDYYRYNGYTVSRGSDSEMLHDLAAAFDKQLADIPQYIEYHTAFLEIKVLGSREDYLAVRDFYIQRIFDILREMEALGSLRETGEFLAPQEDISCNYNDEMQILTMFPTVI